MDRFGAAKQGLLLKCGGYCGCIRVSVAMKKSPLVAKWRSPLVATAVVPGVPAPLRLRLYAPSLQPRRRIDDEYGVECAGFPVNGA
jgi:hypothetical protein